jgi:hypothetical protein
MTVRRCRTEVLEPISGPFRADAAVGGDAPVGRDAPDAVATSVMVTVGGITTLGRSWVDDDLSTGSSCRSL